MYTWTLGWHQNKEALGLSSVLQTYAISNANVQTYAWWLTRSVHLGIYHFVMFWNPFLQIPTGKLHSICHIIWRISSTDLHRHTLTYIIICRAVVSSCRRRVLQLVDKTLCSIGCGGSYAISHQGDTRTKYMVHGTKKITRNIFEISRSYHVLHHHINTLLIKQINN